MSRILLTGVAGFIGAKTAELLLLEGHEVVGIDNLNDYYDVALKNYRLNKLKELEGFKFCHLDIEDRGGLACVFKDNAIDAVINLAARAGVRYSLENPYIYMSTNAMGALNLLECMREFEIKKYILASTSSLYAGQAMPFLETLPVNEPISPYAASKKASEVMAYTYHQLYGIDVSILRYFTVYGPAGRPDMSPFRFIKWIMEGAPITMYGDGKQSRDFTYVDDIARGTISALDKFHGYSIINLGGGNSPVSLNEIIKMLEEYIGKDAVIDKQAFHSADMKDTYADIRKAKEELSWAPEVSVEEGFLNTVNWHKENAEWIETIKV